QSRCDAHDRWLSDPLLIRLGYGRSNHSCRRVTHSPRSAHVAYPSTAMRVVIAGGGTGGHVIPALAIARELRERYAAEVVFVGTNRGIETRLVPGAGFELRLVEIGQLKGVSLARRARTLSDIPRAVLACRKMFADFRPQV